MSKKSKSKENKLWNLSYFTIVFINAFAFINFNMSTSGMPAFAESIESNRFAIGLVTTVCAVSALICRPISGFLSDKYNSVIIALIGLLMMTLAPFIGCFSNNIIWIYVLRCLQGLGWGMTSTACAKLIVISSSKHRISEAIGYSGAISSVCAAISPGMAIIILQNSGGNELMLTIALPTLLATIMTLLIYKNKKLKVHIDRNIKFYFRNCFDKNAIIPAGFVFIISFCYSPMITFVSSYTSTIGIQNSYLFFVCYALTTIVSRPLTGKYVDRHNPFLFGLLAFIFMSISTFILFFVNNVFWLSLSGLIAGMGTGMGMNTFQTMAISLSDEKKTGKTMATFLFGFDFGMGLGSAISGVLSEKIGFSLMFAAFSVISLVGLVGLITSFFYLRKKNENFM